MGGIIFNYATHSGFKKYMLCYSLSEDKESVVPGLRPAASEDA